jgi:hypothetical protein
MTMNVTELHETVVAAAKAQNGWEVERTVSFPAGRGMFVNGVVKFDRPRLHGALPDYRRNETFGTARWNMDGNGNVIFFSGNYDLSSEDASKDFNERGKIGKDSQETIAL